MLQKLHLAKCLIEVTGDGTWSFPVDRLTVDPDFDIEEFELANGDVNQSIGDTRLMFTLSYGYFEPLFGEDPIGLALLIKKFMDLEQVFLYPDGDQVTKFEVLFRFNDFARLVETTRGTINRNASIPLMTKKRLTPTELQFFNTI